MKFSLIAPQVVLISAFLSSMLLSGVSYILCHIFALLYFFMKTPYLRSIHFFTLAIVLILCVYGALGIIFGSKTVDVMRDVVYFSKPFLSILVGYHLAFIYNSKRILVTSIFAAVSIYFVFYIIQIILSGSDIFVMTVQQWRVSTGAGEFLVSVLIILIHSKFITLPSISKIVCLSLLYFQVILTFSRTAFLLLVLYHGVNYIRGSGLLGSMTKTVVAGLILLAVITVVATSGFTDLDFFTKTLNSLKEITPNYTVDVVEASTHWRGFEVALFLNDLMTYSSVQILMGKGMGYVIELPFVIALAGNPYESLWFLHNGYLYIFMKAGLLGVGLFSLCVWKFYRVSSLCNGQNSVITTFFLFTVLSTLVMSGPLEANDFGGLLIIMGYFFAFKSKRGALLE